MSNYVSEKGMNLLEEGGRPVSDFGTIGRVWRGQEQLPVTSWSSFSGLPGPQVSLQ